MTVAQQQHFAYHQTVNVKDSADHEAARIAAAIGEPARARMLYCLMDGHARTSTELAMAAEVAPSTASVHLNKLKAGNLVKAIAQGKHRYYSLHGPQVASVLEGLSVLAGGSRRAFRTTTPSRLRAARTCYDHLAGTVGVALHDRFHALGWLTAGRDGGAGAYELTREGADAFSALGIDLDVIRGLRRRFAIACLDWSERRPHIGGALGAALLTVALKRKWIAQDLDSRAVTVTAAGRREIRRRFDVAV